MNETALRELIDGVRHGDVSADAAVERLRHLPFREVPDAVVDHHRAIRQGQPEAIYGPGKSPEQIVTIVGELLHHDDGPVLLTRSDDAQQAAVEAAFPGADQLGRTMLWRRPAARTDVRVGVVAAGTADVPVADEAIATLDALGLVSDRIIDVGVAGLHRLLNRLETIMAADALIVIAGMEGALASVIGGLTSAPVVAVPTSVGYGASLDGVTALLAMHASCASGISVVGIDNGFGAAMAVGRILRIRS